MPLLEKRTMHHLIQRSAKLFADRPAVTAINQKPITYQSLHTHILTVQKFLKEQGIKPGDTVGLLSENMPNWVVAYFAVTAMGAVIVPILPEFHSSEVQHILRHASCKVAFVSARYMDIVREGSYPDLKSIIRLNDLKPLVSETKSDLLKSILDLGEKEFNKLKQGAKQLAGLTETKNENEPSEDDLAALIYTSGTTGHSKGVMLSHKNIVFDALACESIILLNTEDRLLSILPLAHTYECTIGLIIPLIYGSCIYYLDKVPTPRILADALMQVKPTIMLSVPLVIEKIFKTRILPQFQKNIIMKNVYKVPVFRKKLHGIAGKKLYSFFGGAMRFFGIGGAALAPEVERFLQEAKFPYAIGYGLTETAPLIAGAGPEISRFRSTGPVLKSVQVKLDHADIKTGIGEILVKGDNVMLGYFNDPERTQEVIDAHGWFHTGDLGRFDEDEFLYIQGREKNVIVGPSGENIYPEQIESILKEFDCIVEALVYEDEGEVLAKVNLDYEKLDQIFNVNELTDQEQQLKIQNLLQAIRDQLNNRLASYSRVKKIIEQVEPFQVTPTHKIKRFMYVN